MHLLINENVVPCLINTKVFDKYEIDGKLIFKKEDVISGIKSKIAKLTSLTHEGILREFIDLCILNYHHVGSSNDYRRDLEDVLDKNETIKKKFNINNIQSYFLHKMCHHYKTPIHKSKKQHQFVISDTIEQENEELGRRTELIVNWYLQKYLEGVKWNVDQNNHSKNRNKTNKDKQNNLLDESESFSNAMDLELDEIPECVVTWNNKSGESFKPYDFSIQLDDIEYHIDVKSTRGKDENVFFISINELEMILSLPDRFFIFRLSYIDAGEGNSGIQLNDEFYGCFYKITQETIDLVSSKLKEWKEYYKTSKIRFTIDQFSPVPDVCGHKSSLKFLEKPDINNFKYWKNFDDFIGYYYFRDLERVIETYSVFHDVTNLWTEYLEVKCDEKFALNKDITF